MVEQALPRCEPTRTPGPSDQAVDVGDDCGSVSPQVLRGVTVPLPIAGDQGAVPFQVLLVDNNIAVPSTVVLVDPPSPIDPQVDTRDEAGPLPTTSNWARHGLGVTGCVTSARRVTVTDEVAELRKGDVD
jgi:hypothetical protein